MKITYEDRVYDFDIEEITTEQVKVLESRGLTLMTLEKKLPEGDLSALDFLYWLMVTQSGDKISPDDVSYKPVKLAKAIAAAQEEEDAADPEKAAARKAGPTRT